MPSFGLKFPRYRQRCAVAPLLILAYVLTVTAASRYKGIVEGQIFLQSDCFGHVASQEEMGGEGVFRHAIHRYQHGGREGVKTGKVEVVKISPKSFAVVAYICEGMLHYSRYMLTVPSLTSACIVRLFCLFVPRYAQPVRAQSNCESVTSAFGCFCSERLAY